MDAISGYETSLVCLDGNELALADGAVERDEASVVVPGDGLGAELLDLWYKELVKHVHAASIHLRFRGGAHLAQKRIVLAYHPLRGTAH